MEPGNDVLTDHRERSPVAKTSNDKGNQLLRSQFLIGNVGFETT